MHTIQTNIVWNIAKLMEIIDTEMFWKICPLLIITTFDIFTALQKKTNFFLSKRYTKFESGYTVNELTCSKLVCPRE